MRFYWQHDAQFQPGGLISLFDNASDPPKEQESRGLLLRPDFASHTVTLVKRFANPSKTLLAASQGERCSAAGGDWLLGYGGLPNFTEFELRRPRALRRVRSARNVQDFRTYLLPWSGQPTTARRRSPRGPRGAGAHGLRELERRHRRWPSWQGAQEPAHPSGAGGSSENLAPLTTVPARLSDDDPGERHPRAPTSRSRALSASGHVLGTSAATRRPLMGASPTAGLPPRGALPDAANGLSGPCSPSSRRSLRQPRRARLSGCEAVVLGPSPRASASWRGSGPCSSSRSARSYVR